MEKKILILLIIILVFFPLVRANTTFYEEDIFILGESSEEPSTPTGGSGGLAAGDSPNVSCWKIIDNTCILEEFENYYCPSGYFSEKSICESALETPEKSFIDKVIDTVKEFFRIGTFGIETGDEVISGDSEEVTEDTEEEITENRISKAMIVAFLIIIGYLILNKK